MKNVFLVLMMTMVVFLAACGGNSSENSSDSGYDSSQVMQPQPDSTLYRSDSAGKDSSGMHMVDSPARG